MTAPSRLDIIIDRVSVRRGRRWALRDVSLILRAGERWALVGANGAGKTQLLKLLATDVWPTADRGSVRFREGGAAVATADARPRLAYVGAEAQDKYSRYGWNPAVADLIATGLRNTDLLLSPVTPAERRQVAACLRSCAMTHCAARPFLTLSYGQKRLALLARALIRRPDWLLLDELYNGLDDIYRARVARLLHLARRRGQGWVIAAHRGADVPPGTQRVAELQGGRVARSGPLRPADLGRLGAPAGTRRRPRTPIAADARAPGPVLVRLAAVDLYVDYRLVLRRVDWELRRGEHWAVTGANGSGKSSFLKLLYGDLAPADGGCIERRGLPRGTHIETWKRRIGLVSPELQTDLLVDISLQDLVAGGVHASIGLVSAPTAAEARNARRWLTFFGLGAQALQRPAELSYGQLRRALFARAMAANPRILLLDEPLTGLDPVQRVQIRRLVARLMAGRVTVVMAVHHPEDLPDGVDRELHLSRRTAVARELTMRSAA